MTARRLFLRIRFSKWIGALIASCCFLSITLYLYSSYVPAKELTLAEATSTEDDSSTNSLTQFIDSVPGTYERQPSPIPNGPGENGKGVHVSDNVASKRATQEFGFNVAASDMISLNRTVPDTRPPECKYWHYPRRLPTASVVIVFHNEGWSPLLRTVHSVINRSPPELLKEVLLVDDFSTKDHLKEELDRYVNTFNGKVRLIRNTKREGLIGSRSIGAANICNDCDVVIFLDAHCEANANWLPPLLAPIADDWKTMTVPVIDGIDMNTWAYHQQYGYTGDALFRGIFEWGLLYKESEIPKQEKAKRTHPISEPFKAPTHAGGLFAISKKWFEQLGYYDKGLQIWGGENFELSFKVWQCGGSILFVPCSRIGHVYRNFMPYGFGGLKGPIVSMNYKRVAEVWMDEYKEHYYAREPFIRKHDVGDMSEQIALREKNQCKSFKWYMENVAYDVLLKFPPQPPNVAWGELRNDETGLCVDTKQGGLPGAELGVSHCHHQGGNQLYRINTQGQLSTGEWCILDTNRANNLKTVRCEFGHVDGPWRYDQTSKQLMLPKKEKCAQADRDRYDLVLKPCDDEQPFQVWTFSEIHL